MRTTLNHPGIHPSARALAAADQRSARLAELHHIAELARAARDLVSTGWVRGAWFVDPAGRPTTHRVAAVARGPVTAACLVGAVVHAGGGTGSQPVRRTLELAWHTLHRRPDQPVRWCPAPDERAAHARDLAAWNDGAGRTAGEVAALLERTAVAAERLAATARDGAYAVR